MSMRRSRRSHLATPTKGPHVDFRTRSCPQSSWCVFLDFWNADFVDASLSVWNDMWPYTVLLWFLVYRVFSWNSIWTYAFWTFDEVERRSLLLIMRSWRMCCCLASGFMRFPHTRRFICEVPLLHIWCFIYEVFPCICVYLCRSSPASKAWLSAGHFHFWLDRYRFSLVSVCR